MTTKPELSVSRLCAWHGKAQVLFDVSFDVMPGQCVALMGRNGAGKSSTLKSILHLNTQRSGSIIFRGQSIEQRPTHDIVKMGLGYVPEDRRIFTELTVLDNLKVGTQAPRVGAHHWTTQELFELFPNLEPMQQRLGSQMSGGEQQMLTVARSLLGNPYLILLDEPSEGVAPLVVAQMAKTIIRLKQQGLSILLSEQNIHFAKRVADTAVVLEKGSVQLVCPMNDLMENEPLRQKYLGL
jgi:branched-chain amino acid transport system ATP-binding protein